MTAINLPAALHIVDTVCGMVSGVTVSLLRKGAKMNNLNAFQEFYCY